MPNINLKLADDFALEYDNSILKNNWIGPEVLFKETNHYLHPNSTILDLGIGTGESSTRFQKEGHKITGLDGSAKMLKECRKKKIGTKLIIHNVENPPLPLSKNYFDAVISNGVFHLVYPISTLFSEAKRILKAKGLFAFTFENTSTIESGSEIEPGIWKIQTKTGVVTFKYSEAYISQILSQNNFEIKAKTQFLAFRNLQLKKDFYFTLFVSALT